MTDAERKEFICLLNKFKEEIKGNKEKSRQFLIDAGIYNADGSLTEPYKYLIL